MLNGVSPPRYQVAPAGFSAPSRGDLGRANAPPPCSAVSFPSPPKVLRYFRKDGHNWRNKKDGKTVKEAHEKLKVGSIDVLHCYYAHEEDNENFQRRCYWMLEQSFSGLVRAIIHLKDIDRDIRKASRLVIARAIFQLKDMGQRHRKDIHNDMYPTFLQ
ncbi:hypothetical protein Bca4012_049627 [Brassica carinata]